MPSPFRLLAASSILAASACTTLGPVSTSTGISPIAHHGPSVDVQAGIVSGIYASETTQEEGEGAAMPQLSVTVEPDRMVEVPGLVVGAGVVVEENAPHVVPYIGWRGHLDPDRTVALAVVAFGARAQDDAMPATVTVTHAGAEAVLDLNMSGPSRAAELHVLLAGSAQGLWASGTYCVLASGEGTDCDNDGNEVVGAEIDDLLPAARGGLALDFLRRRSSVFHGGRLELTFGGGLMPHVVRGTQTGRQSYASGGLTLTLAFGSET